MERSSAADKPGPYFLCDLLRPSHELTRHSTVKTAAAVYLTKARSPLRRQRTGEIWTLRQIVCKMRVNRTRVLEVEGRLSQQEAVVRRILLRNLMSGLLYIHEK